MGAVKEAALKILESLSEDATWDDLMYELYVNKKVASGQEAANEGKVLPHDQARRKVAKR
jgi:hypothetical protein